MRRLTRSVAPFGALGSASLATWAVTPSSLAAFGAAAGLPPTSQSLAIPSLSGSATGLAGATGATGVTTGAGGRTGATTGATTGAGKRVAPAIVVATPMLSASAEQMSVLKSST